MNELAITNTLRGSGFKAILLALIILAALFVVGYNWLYLTQSLHVSSKHIGLTSPKYLKRIVRISIFLAVVTIFLSLGFLLFGFY